MGLDFGKTAQQTMTAVPEEKNEIEVVKEYDIVADRQQMNADLDAVKQKHIIYVDDIGTENLSVKYGEKRLAFAELADEAEKKGKLLILTTNLTIDELREKYGERTIDRLRAITKTVLFSGESLRK